MKRITTVEIDDVVQQLPLRWVICDRCEGAGKSSAYLGAITSDDWHHDWHPDEQDAYMRGDYDRTCEDCRGRGSVQEVDEDRLSTAQRAAYHDALNAEQAAYAAECSERIMFSDWERS